MKKTSWLAGALIVIAAMTGAAFVVGGEETKGEPSSGEGSKRLVMKLPDSLEWKELHGGAKMAVLWGTPDTGPFGAFVKFEPDLKYRLHHHPSDLRIVVVKGAYILTTPEGEKRFEPGSYLFEPKGYDHRTSSDPKEGAIFFVEGLGRFGIDDVGGPSR